MGYRSIQRMLAWLLVGSGFLAFIYFSPINPELQRFGAALAAAGVVWHLALNRFRPKEQQGFPVLAKGNVEPSVQPPARDTAPVPRHVRTSPPLVPLYRRIMAGALVLAGLVLAVLGVFAASGPARANIWTAALGLGVWGLVIRFQHVRI